ncbi:MAG: S41 family peptidase [Defluviitaleaceae bacterium]|nr:S41 family peptidase [Defluviitaleaceae bacterium]
MKQERSTFIKGILVGIIVIVWGHTVVSGGMVFYRRHFEQEIPVAEKIELIVSILEDRFIGDLDHQAMQDAMFSGLLDGVGDIYTSYMTAYEFRRFRELSAGTFVGIGAVVSRTEDGSVLIVSPYRGSPAYNAGILPGDRILEVNGEDITANDLVITIGMIQGEEGTPVNLTIYREMENRTFEIEIIRAVIEIPTVHYEMLENNIGYVHLSGFDRVTYGQFVSAYENLASQGMEGLILDLRNNPGGMLDVVVNITSRLVPEGAILYIQDSTGNRRARYSTPGEIEIPLVILINGHSASASEVLAGAAVDHGVARLVGQQSFGKGSVQDIVPLPDGSALRITIATYYTPNGTAIDGYGLTPTYIVEIEDYQSARIHQIAFEYDIQLQKAIEVIEGWVAETE